MFKFTSCVLVSSIILFSAYGYNGSTTAVVTLVGGIIKAKNVDENAKKFKRKDCPVCKGKGWYISGDKITEVPCGYCEAETKDSEVTHPPVVIHNNNGCKTRVIKK